MSQATLYSLLFGGVGLLFIALGVTLFQERVPPNSTYGFRTAKSLSDPKIWYEINHIQGRFANSWCAHHSRICGDAIHRAGSTTA